MASWSIAPPSDLEAWEVTVDGDTFVIFEWQTAQLAGLGELTDAERSVLADLLRGESNATIGRRRQRSARTIANQVASIFRKMGASSRAELISRVVRGCVAHRPDREAGPLNRRTE
jgi:DNA-binding NarL/FixJ family response regulator